MIFRPRHFLLLALACALTPAAQAQDATAPGVDEAKITAEISASAPATANASEVANAEPAPDSSLPIPFIKAPDDLWIRLRQGFRMPQVDDPLVRKWESYYASRPQYLQRIFDRSRPYLYHIADEVEKRGMPMELALLPMIESAYNPTAVSPAQAAGMWQFMPMTGKRFGLERTWWYDGRRDVVAATSAALSYLGDLYGMFGDWSLVLASYNWGENAVARAVTKKRNTGVEQPDYSTIKMPNETRNYVPKLLAIRNIISNPAAFGIALLAIPNKPYFTVLKPDRHMDVKVVAELAEVPIEELLRLNPGFVRPVIAYKEDRQLVLPTDKVETFNRNLASYDKPLLNWQPYVTRAGEPYSQLATRFGLSLAQLKDINDISAKELRARGQTILVPKSSDIARQEQKTLTALAANRKGEAVDHGETAPVTTAAPTVTATSANTTGKHQVASGETLYSIARQYQLTPDELKKFNGLKNEQIKVGQVLRVLADTPKPREHVIKKGETLASIARQYKVSEAELKKWNPASKILPGKKLIIH